MTLSEHTSRTGVWLSDSPCSFSCVFQKSRRRKHVTGCELLGSRSTLSYMKVREPFLSFFTERINSGRTMWTLPRLSGSLLWCVVAFASFPLGLGNSKLIWTNLEMRALPFPPHFLLLPEDSHPALHFLSSVCPDWLCRVACSSLF